MHLNPYGEDAVLLAVDLTNAPVVGQAELADRCREYGVVVARPVTEEDVATVRAVLGLWLTVVEADDPTERAARLNRLLESHAAHPRLTDHAATGWHLHYRPDDLTVGRVVAALVAVGTALHLAGRGMHRLGRCAADGCSRVYADTSRNGRQRFCSPACANRAAVRRHRSRASSRRTGT